MGENLIIAAVTLAFCTVWAMHALIWHVPSRHDPLR